MRINLIIDHLPVTVETLFELRNTLNLTNHSQAIAQLEHHVTTGNQGLDAPRRIMAIKQPVGKPRSLTLTPMRTSVGVPGRRTRGR